MSIVVDMRFVVCRVKNEKRGHKGIGSEMGKACMGLARQNFKENRMVRWIKNLKGKDRN